MMRAFGEASRMTEAGARVPECNLCEKSRCRFAADAANRQNDSIPGCGLPARHLLPTQAPEPLWRPLRRQGRPQLALEKLEEHVLLRADLGQDQVVVAGVDILADRLQ